MSRRRGLEEGMLTGTGTQNGEVVLAVDVPEHGIGILRWRTCMSVLALARTQTSIPTTQRVLGNVYLVTLHPLPGHAEADLNLLGFVGHLRVDLGHLIFPLAI